MITMKKGAVYQHGHKHFEETYVVPVPSTQEQHLKPVITSESITMKSWCCPVEDTKLLVVVRKGVVIDGMTD